KTWQLNRRHFLRGLGVSLALPAFESILPVRSLAAAPPTPGLAPSGMPLRMAFLYVPNGVNRRQWKPTGTGADYQLGKSLEPLAPESNPRLVFERLFGSGKPGERQRNFDQRIAQQKSVLDFVSDDAKTMQRQLGRNDQQKLDEYLTGVREIENRIQKAERFRK